MNMRKLSINKACVLLGTLLLLAVGAVCTTVYLLTRNIIAVRCVFLFSLFVLLCVIFFVALIRWKLVQFSDAFCGQMDDMLSGDIMQPKQTIEEESLFYKINYRLHEKVQLIKLTSLGCQKFLLLLRRNLIFKQRVVDHFQVGNRGLDLMRDVRDQLLQVSPFLCDAVFIFLHDFI